MNTRTIIGLVTTLLLACTVDEDPAMPTADASTSGLPISGTATVSSEGGAVDTTAGSMPDPTSTGEPDPSSSETSGSPIGSSSGDTGLEGPLCILLLGDSITQADSRHVGYRYWLWEMLVEDGWDVDFVGSHDDNFGGGTPAYPNPAFDRDHEGHWGWTADQLLAELPTWLKGYTPSLAIIHVGTNDNFLGQPVDGTIEEIAQIIEQLRGNNPEVVVLLAQLIPSSFAEHGELNASLLPLGEELWTPTSPVIVVEPPPGFDTRTDLYDGVHPSDSGEQKMAQNFSPEVAAALRGRRVEPCSGCAGHPRGSYRPR